MLGVLPAMMGLRTTGATAKILFCFKKRLVRRISLSFPYAHKTGHFVAFGASGNYEWSVRCGCKEQEQEQEQDQNSESSTDFRILEPGTPPPLPLNPN
jgi:hypothetical protein